MARTKRKGFTLIEILLVVVIIGIMLAVIVPRAWRANVDTKYGLVRQACSELASYAMQWAEEQIVAQTDDSTATINNYLQTLAGGTTAGTVYWVARNAANNWNTNNAGFIAVTGRNGAAVNANPEAKVQEIVPPEKQPRNPFNGASCFSLVNDGAGGTIVPGAVGSAYGDENGWSYYALIFMGTDSTATNLFHAGQDSTLVGLRNGVFMARTR